MSDLTIIRRSLTARGFSTVITVLMVATSVGLMLVLLAMREAGRSAFERGTGNMHMVVSRDPSPLVTVLNGIFHAGAPRNPITWAKYRQIASDSPWSPLLEYAIPLQMGDSYRGSPVVATDERFFTAFEPEHDQPWEIAEGRLFEAPFEVVAGAEAAATNNLGVGDELFLTHGSGGSREAHQHREFAYELVGILEPTGGPHDRALFTDLASSWVIHAHDRRKRDDPGVASTTADDLLEADKLITGIYLRVITRGRSRLSGAQQQVFDQLRRDTSITVADPGTEIANLFRIVSNIDDLFLAMAAVVMISGAVAILLTLYTSMEQRRRQIAILRVLGRSRGRVFGLIISESAIIGILGAAAGILLTLIGVQVVAAMMRSRLGLVIEPGLPLEAALVVTVATIALAALAGVIPAVAGYRTPVVESL